MFNNLMEVLMFWIFVLGITLVFGLIKLGALSVWVAVLSTALKLVVLTVMLLAAAWIARTLWRRSKRTERQG